MGQAGTAESEAPFDERYRSFFESSPLGMAIADVDGRYLATNPSFRQLLDIREGQFETARLTDHLSAQQGPVERNTLAQLARESAGTLDFEKPYRRPDGNLTWLRVFLFVVPGGLNISPHRLSVVIEDITGHKRSDEVLQQRLDRLQSVLDLNNRIASDLDLRQLVRSLAGGLRSLLRYDSLTLSFPESDAKEMRSYSVQVAEDRGFVHEHALEPMHGSIAGRALQTRQAFLFHSVPSWVNSSARSFLEKQGVKSGCVAPLVRGASVLAVLTLVSLAENAFAESDLDLLTEAAKQAAIAVENASRFYHLNESRKRLVGERLYLEDEISREREFDEIVGGSRALRMVLEAVQTVAPTDSTVLILGETGTGKELIARAIHNRSPRRNHTLVRADCASIPAGLLESELFGHEKGAFTGAIARNLGRIELSDRGSLFLDEVGDIPLELQSKLLRVLQEGEFERLGSTRTIRVDFRLVAATNRNLLKMVERGEFRRDLYYRLNVFPIQVPALRDRRDDIPLLAWHFAKKYARRMNKQIDTIQTEDLEALKHYNWPGNVRELQNIMERSVVGSSHGVLQLAPLPEVAGGGEVTASRHLTLAEAEREHILQALRETDWVIAGPHGAAQRLGVRRTTLLYKMRRLGISRPGSSPV